MFLYFYTGVPKVRVQNIFCSNLSLINYDVVSTCQSNICVQNCSDKTKDESKIQLLFTFLFVRFFFKNQHVSKFYDFTQLFLLSKHDLKMPLIARCCLKSFVDETKLTQRQI